MNTFSACAEPYDILWDKMNNEDKAIFKNESKQNIDKYISNEDFKNIRKDNHFNDYKNINWLMVYHDFIELVPLKAWDKIKNDKAFNLYYLNNVKRDTILRGESI